VSTKGVDISSMSIANSDPSLLSSPDNRWKQKNLLAFILIQELTSLVLKYKNETSTKCNDCGTTSYHQNPNNNVDLG
jgi:hypothetical protein